MEIVSALDAEYGTRKSAKVHKDVLRVLGRANSMNVRKVLWVCGELRIPFEREDWGRGFRSAQSPEFLTLNPAGQIPVVVDGSVVLRESNAIIRYLASKYCALDIYPDELTSRAKVELWMDWVAYDVTHALRGAYLGGQLKEAPWNNGWFVEQGRRDLIALMTFLNEHLSRCGPYLLNEFTLADVPVGIIVNRWYMLKGFDKPNLPYVQLYYDLLKTRAPYRLYGANGLA